MAVVLISSLFLKNNSSLEPVVNRVKPDSQQTSSGFTLGENFISRQFWLLVVAFFCFGFCLNAIMVHIVPHITDLKISPTSAAGVLSTINGMSIAGNLLLSIVADRVGNKRLFIGTFILEALVLAWLVGSHSVAGFYLFGAVFGLAIGGAIPQESPLIAYIFGMRTHGTTLTVISLGHSIGAAIGSFLAGYVFDLSGSYRPAFIICAGICIIGMLALVTVRPLTHK